MTEQSMTPAEILMTRIAKAIDEFDTNQTDEVTYRDINLVLNAAWEVLSAVPTVACKSLEERISSLTSVLDDIVAETHKIAEEYDDIEFAGDTK